MRAHLPDLAIQARRRGLVGDLDLGPAPGFALVGGPDAGALLQAQLTSDVNALGPGEGQLSARLDRQGRLVAWFSLHRLPDRGQPFPSYLLVLPRAEVPGLVADLAAAVITEDALVEDVSADFSGWLVQWPVEAEASLEPASLLGSDVDWPALPDQGLAVTRLPAGGEAWVVKRSWGGDPACLVLHPGGQGRDEARVAVAEAAAAHDLVDLDALDAAEAGALWTWLESEAGWPRLGRDLPAAGRVLPQTGLEHHVVSFTKGCYLGQEVVARLRTYGTVPEALRAVVWDDFEPEDLAALPAAGEKCLAPDGTKLGTWAGSFWSPVLQRSASLVLLGRNHRTPGAALTVAGPDDEPLEGEIVLLPVHSGADAQRLADHLHDQALVHFGAGRDDQAVALLEKALGLDPGNAEAAEALGVILGRQEKFHEAIDIFRRLEEIAPAEPMVHTNLSLFYMKLGDKDEAERQKALATLKKFGGDGDPAEAAALAAAEERARREDAERKLTMFSEVLELDADDPLALMGMGKALHTLDRGDEAVGYLTRALAGQKDNSALYATLGRVLEDLDRSAEAAVVFRDGIAVASRKGDLMPLREMEHRLRLLAPA